MAAQSTFEDKIACFWTRQFDAWTESANLMQCQAQKMSDMWVGHTLEVQKENQKFFKELMDTASKGQMEMWKTAASGAKEATTAFTHESIKTAHESMKTAHESMKSAKA